MVVGLTKTKAEQAWYELCQISMDLGIKTGGESKRTWRVLEDGLVVGYLGRKRALEFGIGSHAERVAMAWAERLNETSARRFATEHPELEKRHKQTHLG